MAHRRIRVFLGAYVNYANAQNLNCRSLARHLDRERFDVFALLHPSGELGHTELAGVRLFRCRRPLRLTRYAAFLWGIWCCDVAYLPKGEIVWFNRLLLKCLRRPSFTTVEGVLDGSNYERALAAHGSPQGVLAAYTFTDKTFSITRFLMSANQRRIGLRSDDVLFLGVDAESFAFPARVPAPLTQVAFIGDNMADKGIHDYLALAAEFPSLTFHVVGSGQGRFDLPAAVAARGLANVVMHGRLNPPALASLLRMVQLHVLPSRFEGFPKVTLETAAAGVPSMVYADYGAAEWIVSGENGIVVQALEEMKRHIARLIEAPHELARLSVNAVALGVSFDWTRKVREWERVLRQLAEPTQPV